MKAPTPVEWFVWFDGTQKTRRYLVADEHDIVIPVATTGRKATRVPGQPYHSGIQNNVMLALSRGPRTSWQIAHDAGLEYRQVTAAIYALVKAEVVQRVKQVHSGARKGSGRKMVWQFTLSEKGITDTTPYGFAP